MKARLYYYVMGLVISAIFAWLTLRDVSWRELGVALQQFAPTMMFLALAMLSAGYAIRIERWRRMLCVFRPKCSFRAAAGPFLAGFALNNIAPLRSGDIVRIVAFSDRLGVPGSRIAATLVLERAMDLLSVLVFLFACMAFLPPGSVGRGLYALVVGALLASFTLGVLVIVLPRLMAGLAVRFLQNRSVRAVPMLPKVLRFTISALVAIGNLSTPKLLVELVLLSVLAWAFEGAVFLAVAHGLELEVNPAGAIFAMATSTLMTLVPGMPGHIGTFHFGARLAFETFGAGAVAAAAAALTVHALLWIPVTLAGGVWLLYAWGGAAAGRRLK